MLSPIFKSTGLAAPLLFLLSWQSARAQCPVLDQTATLTSPDCAAGLSPCTVCPGDQITLTATGSGLQPGSCVNWYYGTTNNFNPYNGQGTLIGCSPVQATPPNPCVGGCPQIVGLYVDACGTEVNNEVLALLSGGGFFVDDLSLDFDDGNGNIGTACNWQEPDAATVASIQGFCPAATVIGAGPGEAVPANVPVVVFTSAGYDFNYNFGSFCPVASVIYVMQNGCTRSSEAFPQSGGAITTSISVACGCFDDFTYNSASLSGGNGAFVVDAGIFPVYSNAGCGFPGFPGGGGGGSSAIQILPFTFTVTDDMCNGGPYFVVGVVEPLNPVCPDVFTNYLGFDVPCPMPVLTGASLCQNAGNLNLSQLVTPAGTAGVWSGPGVSGNTFSPIGQTGTVSLTFTPAGGCSAAATTSVEVFAQPQAVFAPAPTVCTGQSGTLSISFTGEAPWLFDLYAGATLLGSYQADNSPFNLSISPAGPTNYSLQNFQDLNCAGANASVFVNTATAPAGVLSLAGAATVCSGQAASLSVDFTGGSAPYTFQLGVNGVPAAVQNAATDPFSVSVSPTSSTTYTLVAVGSNGCTASGTGSVGLTVTPSPNAVIPTDTLPYCAGQPVTVPVTLTGPGPYTFNYSLNGIAQTSVSVPDTVHAYNLVFVPTDDTTVVRIISLTNGTCPGTFSGVLTFVETPPPTATLSGDQTLCVPGNANLTVNFTGMPPYVLDYTVNGAPAGPDTVSVNPYTWVVPVTATTTFALTGLTTGQCTGTASGQAVVTVAPLSATISGGGQLCTNNTDSVAIVITFSGTGPYTFRLRINNILQPPVTTSANPYVFNVRPNIGTFYQLFSVDNPQCPGMVSGLATVFMFTPPTADMSGDATFCDSADTQVTIDFTGTGPFTVQWSQDGVLQDTVQTSEDPFFIPVNTYTSTDFVLVSVESPGCVGSPDGSATLTVNYTPTFSNVQFNCNPAASNYTVEFDVAGATLPLTLVSGSGSFSGTHFISNPIAQANAYQFVFHDAVDCSDVTVSGNSGCNCTSEAGTMDTGPLVACMGNDITATHQGGQILDGDDALRFVLHTNAVPPLGTILGWNTTPVFGFAPPMTAGTTYYISAVAGDALPDGTIDLADPCLSVSPGAPVTFYTLPTALLDTAITICAGQSVQLPVLIAGSMPVTLTYALNGVTAPAVTGINSSPYVLDIQPTVTTTVEILSVTDQHCSVVIADTSQVTVNPLPEILNVETVCDTANNTYTVEFDLVGTPPYQVNGLAGFVFNGHFTSIPVSSTTPDFFITLTDAGGCGQADYDGLSSCLCGTGAGTMDTTLAEACAGTTVTAMHNGDQGVQANDVFEFVLHTNPGAILGTILATSPTPSFAFLPGTTQPGTVYYVSPVAGNDDGNGHPDPADPCYSVGAGGPVVWRIPPTASISGNYDVCPGQTQEITLTFSGTGPFIFSWTDQTQTFTDTSAQPAFLINPVILQTDTFMLTAVQDSFGCAGTLNGQAVVTTHTTPEVANLEVECTPDGTAYTIEFDVINADLPIVNVSLQPFNYDPVTGHFASDPIPAAMDSYAIIVTDNWLCGRDSVGGTVLCSCTTDAGILAQVPQFLCNGEAVSTTPATGTVLESNDTLLYFLVTSPDPASWVVLDTSATPDFPFPAGQITPTTPYYIVAVAGDTLGNAIDLNDPCLSVVTGPTVRWRPPVTATLSGLANICAGDTATFVVNLTGGGPYSMDYTVDGEAQAPQTVFGNTFTLQIIPLSTVTYELTGVSASSGCPGTASGTATVVVDPEPQVLDLVQICDYPNQTYEIQFNIGNGDAPNPVYTISGLSGTLNDTTFTSVTMPASQDFSFVVSNPTGCSSTYSGVSACLCTTDAGTLDLTPIDACIGDQIDVPANGDAALDPEDVLMYVLCEDPASLPQGILAFSLTPEISYQSNLLPDSTYFIVAIAGNGTPLGLVDTLDPCISISSAVPLIFHSLPTALLAGDTTVCAGGNAQFAVQFTGTPPFSFVFANNNVNQTPVSAPQPVYTIASNNVQAPQVFTPVSVQDAWCAGTVDGQATVDVIAPEGYLTGDSLICPGSPVTLALDLDGAPLYDVTISGGLSPILLQNVQQDTLIVIDPGVETTYSLGSLTATGLGCVGTTGGSVTVQIDTITLDATLSDHDGYNVSCAFGSTDGAIALMPAGGIPPFTAQWSNGANGLSLANLEPGAYAVTLTDNEGCSALDSFFLNAPPPPVIEFTGLSPRCYGDLDGGLRIDRISGSVDPYTLRIEGDPVGNVASFPFTLTGLPAGLYELEVTDGNGCTAFASALVPEAEELLLDLGPDTTLHFGDSIVLNGILSTLNYDTLWWSPATALASPDSLITMAMPLQSIRYQLTVVDSNGCTVRDEILLIVQRTGRVYIPNVIMPGSSANSILAVYGGPEVTSVNFLRVYDRWGECVYEGLDLRPNFAGEGWDGRWRGREVPPAVYVYVVEVAYIDGTTELLKGDVTVVR